MNNLSPAPYRNLLPAAPPVVEKSQLFLEACERASGSLCIDVMTYAQRVAAALEPLANAIKGFCEALNGIADFSPPPQMQPALRYQLHGYPYGKNTRGKKRWLLEQKRRRRA